MTSVSGASNSPSTYQLYLQQQQSQQVGGHSHHHHHHHKAGGASAADQAQGPASLVEPTSTSSSTPSATGTTNLSAPNILDLLA